MECYVCENQDDNSGKCLKTIKTCEPDEDMCLSEIKWGSKLCEYKFNKQRNIEFEQHIS